MSKPKKPTKTGKATDPKEPRFERPFAAIRKDLGWTLDWAAIRLGCSPRHLRRLELAQAPVSMEFARKMAERYEVDLNDLFSHKHRAVRAKSEKGEVVSGNATSPVGSTRNDQDLSDELRVGIWKRRH